MARWWLCSVMTSYISVRLHGCCQRNRPHKTKRGACRRISFRAAFLSECAQTCPSDRKNHLAPFRNLQLLLRRHSASGTRATTAGRWCSTLGSCALRRAFLPIHRASSRANGSWARARVVVGGSRAQALWSNLQMSFVTTHTIMIDVADLSELPFSRQHPGLWDLLRRWLWKAL